MFHSLRDRFSMADAAKAEKKARKLTPWRNVATCKHSAGAKTVSAGVTIAAAAAFLSRLPAWSPLRRTRSIAGTSVGHRSIKAYEQHARPPAPLAVRVGP